MDHGGEAARPTMVGSADLGTAGAVQGGEARMSTGTFHGQLGAAAARRAGFHELVRHVHATVGRGEVPVAVFHHEPGPGVAFANIVASWRQPGPVDVVLVGPQHPDGAVPVHDNYGVVGEHLRRLLPFVGIGACSVAVNGLAAGLGSPAVAFHLFVLLLGGLLLVILHVLRV